MDVLLALQVPLELSISSSLKLNRLGTDARHSSPLPRTIVHPKQPSWPYRLVGAESGRKDRNRDELRNIKSLIDCDAKHKQLFQPKAK